MVENLSKWGRRTARARYGESKSGAFTPKFADASYPQKLGDERNLQGPDHDNDHSNDWVRGKDESAEGKPDFKRSQGYK